MALFQGMYVTAEGGRWTSCEESIIYFRIGDLPEAETVLLDLKLATHRDQMIDIILNGSGVTSLNIDRIESIYTVQLDTNQLKANQINSVKIISGTLERPIWPEDGFSSRGVGPVGVKLIDFTLKTN